MRHICDDCGKRMPCPCDKPIHKEVGAGRIAKSTKVYRCGLCGFSEAWAGDGTVVWECPKCAAAHHAMTGE